MSTGETSAADLLPSERSSFRAIGDPYKSYQEKRRLNALQRQHAARLRSAHRARTLALEPGQQEDGAEDRLSLDEPTPAEIGAGREDAAAEDADMEPSTSNGMEESDSPMRGRGRHGRGRGAHVPARRRQQQQQGQTSGAGGVRAYGQRYGNELMQPEWMTDVPSNLAAEWLVMPRPEGMRCLLVTSRGRTVSWLRNGAPLHRFHSPLPGGSPASVVGCGGSAAAAAAAGDYCLLDCIFHPPNHTYYVLDLLCWRGYALYDTAAEFRTFWLTNKFREEGLMSPPPPNAADAAATAAVAVSEPVPPPAAVAEAAAHGRRDAPYGSGGCGGHDVSAEADGGDVDTEMGGGDGGGSSRPRRQRLQRKQEQQQQEQLVPPPSVSYRIVPLPVRACTLQGLRAAYGRVPPPPAATGAASDGSSDLWGCSSAAAGSDSAGAEAEDMEAEGDEAGTGFEFVRDGLYFLHRQGHYCPGSGTTPLALLWKDLGCSRYLLDTDATGQPLEHQAVVLSYRADRTVATEDEPPIVLGQLPEAFVAAMGDKLKPGRLLRFSIRQGGLIFHEGRPAGADLHYEGPANQRRGRADSFSKILFQRLARTAPITASNLAAAVAAAAAGAQAAEGAEGALPRNAFGYSDGCSSSEAAAAAVVVAAGSGSGLVLGGGTGGLVAAGDMAVE